ncbi:GNRHR [Mytilus coruscus]|uniref:GNRHR n=1 Tax=Mytilus coruscus TaxID=42192 RepID=A0A6J8DVW9_MYTCO|nr:GNRHR [Mytilus coruscus]
MDKTTTVAVLNYQEDNYSKLLTNSASQCNISTLIPDISPPLDDIEYNEFVRRCSEFSVMLILCLFGTVGNVHTILVYLRVKEMKERFHVRTLIIWLSVVDLTTSVVVMPFEMVAFRWRYSISSNAVCQLFRYTAYTTGMSSWLILTVIGHERYKNIYGILLGIKSVVPCKICKVTSWLKGKCSLSKHNVVCILIIISSLIISTPVFVFIGIVETVPLNYARLLGTQCTTHNKYRSKLTAGLYSGVVGLFGISCFVYCSYCYGKILYLIHTQSKKEKARREKSIHFRAKVHKTQQSSYYKKRKPHYKVTISLIVATGFSLCGFIIFAIGTAFGVSNSVLRHAIITGVMKRGSFINNACNPVIYFMCDSKFRQACKKLYIKQT